MTTGSSGEQPTDFAWLEDLDFEYTRGAEEKLGRLVMAGTSLIALRGDFDGVFNDEEAAGTGDTGWGVMHDFMPTAAAREEHDRLKSHFIPLERSGRLTFQDSETWQRLALRLLIGANAHDMYNAASERIQLRDGVTQLFEDRSNLGMALTIHSAGEAGIIEAVLKRYGLKADGVHANRPVIDESGTIIGWREDSFVHSYNKHSFKDLESKPHAIVLGDNFHDIHIAHGKHEPEDILGIRIDGGISHHINPDGTSGWPKYVGDSFVGGFDMVATQPNLIAVSGLVHCIDLQHRLAA